MVFAQKQVDWQATCVRYRNVEGVRMTEQTDREHHSGNGSRKKNMRMLREAWSESNPAHCNERRRGETRRGDTKRGFCVNRGLSWNRIMSVNKGWNKRWKAWRGWWRGRGEGGGVRRGKNPRQGESLDKDQRQNKQYNYEQARSTRHAGRPADSMV